MTENIDYLRAGDPVQVRTAAGDWIAATATSGLKGSDGAKSFVKAWVKFPDDDREWPWPVEAIRRPE